MTPRLALLPLLVIGACQPADDATESEAQAPEVEAIELAGTLELGSTCVDLDGRVVASISPEGHAWLIDAAPGSAQVTIVDARGLAREAELLHPPSVVQAWSGSRVSYVADGQIWAADVDDGYAEPAAWPSALALPESFCGDPSLDGDGFVIAGEGLLQRDAGLWWRWRTPAGDEFEPVALAHSYGACLDREGAAWVTVADGSVWRVASSDARVVEQLDGATTVVFDVEFGAAGLIDGGLVYGAVADDAGGGWFAPELPTADGAIAEVQAIAASSGTLWVGAEDRLLAFDGEAWFEVRVDGAAVEGITQSTLWADAEAAWIARDGQLCRLVLEPGVELAGVRPLARLGEAMLDLELLGPGAMVTGLRVLLDGQLVAEHDGGPLPWQIAAFDLGAPGWHVLEVETDAGIARSLEVELRTPEVGTWLADIQPIAELHCTAVNGCHDPDGAGDKPILSEYAGWVEHADAIRARVGLLGDMPPPASRLGSWDAEEVAQILAWFDAGMPIGQEGP